MECEEILLERGARHSSMISVHVIKHVRNDDSADLSVFCISSWPLLRAGAEVNDLGPSAGLRLRAEAEVNDSCVSAAAGAG